METSGFDPEEEGALPSRAAIKIRGNDMDDYLTKLYQRKTKISRWIKEEDERFPSALERNTEEWYIKETTRYHKKRIENLESQLYEVEFMIQRERQRQNKR